MKNKLINLFKILDLYFYLFIFFCLFLTYCYLRFIRERVPKDIPYSLTDFSFYVLLFVCISYTYVILRLIKPKTPPQFILYTMQKFMYPISLLQNKIIYHPTFYPYYYNFL